MLVDVIAIVCILLAFGFTFKKAERTLGSPKSRVDYEKINRIEHELGFALSNYRDKGVDPDFGQPVIQKTDQVIHKLDETLNPDLHMERLIAQAHLIAPHLVGTMVSGTAAVYPSSSNMQPLIITRPSIHGDYRFDVQPMDEPYPVIIVKPTEKGPCGPQSARSDCSD